MNHEFAIKAKNVSLLGGLYFPDSDKLFYKSYRYLPELFSYNNGMINSRGEIYYQKLNCFQMIEEIKNLKNKYMIVPSFESESIIKYTIADHMLSKLIRIIDFMMGHDDFLLLPKSNFDFYIKAINWCASVVIKFIIGGVIPKYNGELEGVSIIPSLALQYPREQIDGDNHYISLTSALLLTKEYDCVIGVALGGIGCAAITSCYLNKPLGIIKLSNYDEVNEKNEIPFHLNWESKGRILIVDDNCGSGTTLTQATEQIKKITGNIVSAYATELHWEKYFRNKIYNHQDYIFNPNDLSELSPWCFRHFELIRLLREKEMSNINLSSVNTKDWLDYSISLISILQVILPEDKYLVTLMEKAKKIS